MSTHEAERQALAGRSSTHAAPSGHRSRPARIGDGTVTGVATVLLLVVIIAFWEVGSRLSWWSEGALSRPTAIAPELVALTASPTFWADFGRTANEIVLAVVLGSLLGILGGVLFWKLPTLGRAAEPYLASFYAVPLVLFYPVMIVVVGINEWSVIILAALMAAIPMVLNTWAGLGAIPAVQLKLARSVNCTPSQTFFRLAFPSASPYIFAGLKLGTVYALVGVVAMEFVTAAAGLGYRIRYLYESFDVPAMYAYIVVVLVVAVLITAVLAVGERFVPGSATAASGAPRVDRSTRRGVVGLTSVGLLLLALAAWQAASTMTFVIPGVDETLEALLRFFQNSTNLIHVRATVTASAMAFAIGVVIGAASGLVLGLSRYARLIFEPSIIALNGLPKIVLYPVLLPIFALSGSKVVMGALFALFPVLINVATGVRRVPQIHWSLARSLSCSRLQTLMHIVLPGIKRPLLTGVRLAVSLATVGVVLSEFFATRYGLGRLTLHAYDVGTYDSMMSIILLLVGGSLVVSMLLWRLEKRVR